ncbi:MAG: Dihydropteroate synthase [candidate division TA06 bacterium ADurb.Bin131]|uniref:Dihydropteroate synthase n=1 Tax=candidate division TA06 bacterium ADurb.Bin131 TaxID=1852827 RepID=A0A1V6C5Z1_UNCT6|nr:MAG: Dihydropteroate synthase [candidate division TA06 bacterium ADurb.Bin131]HOC02628.1 dihydropteroate synthase [bacterium]HON05358.1 dihydropteroate synthase [bacterium]HPC29051.1 dihydropteroate synthase [bacterium]
MKIRVITPSCVKGEMERISVHPAGIHLMELKTSIYPLKISDVNVKQANVIKQEALSVGADAAVPYSVLNLENKNVDVIVMATLKQYRKLALKFSQQVFGLKDLGEEMLKTIERYNRPVSGIKNKKIPEKEFLIMGILNITPDSFSDGGTYFDNVDAAIQRAIEMQQQGADIIDIGGESSRPGASPISEEEEIRRVIPVIKGLRGKVSCLISCDTSRSNVAIRAIEEGADIINDIYALKRDEKMAQLIVESGCAVILMHMKGTPETMQKKPFYDDVIEEITDFFDERIQFSLDHKISKDQIILDPGIGFGKRIQDNLEIIKRIREFTCFNLPLCLGTSRKSFIGKIAGNPSETERLPGTIATCVSGYINGARIFRVHDVKQMYQALKLTSEIYNC